MTFDASTFLNELELDALTELANMGVGRAAVSLRELVGAQILLSVPKVQVVAGSQAASLLGDAGMWDLVAVRQNFEGDINGLAFLIFPDRASLELVRIVGGLELTPDAVADLQDDALIETGNIMLNNCISTIANLLHQGFRMSLPEILRGNSADIFGSPFSNESVVVFHHIIFSIRDRNISGIIALSLDMPSLTVLKRLVRAFIDEATNP